MKWLLIVGIVLFAGWYMLAPLFTPLTLRGAPSRRPDPQRRTRRGRPDLTVINGSGRLVDDETE